MKLFPTLIAVAVSISGFASVHAQHHLPPSATSNANINGGINSPTSSNIDIDSVATIIDKANDNTERKLHDMLTSVKDVIEEKYGLDLIDALALGGNGTRRLSSKTNKSGKAIIDGVDELLTLVAAIVLLLVQFLGLGGGGTTTTTSTQAATTSATTSATTTGTTSATTTGTTSATTQATTTGTTSATTTGTACSLGVIVPGSVTNNNPCCEDADCVPGVVSFCRGTFCVAGMPSLGSVDCSTPCTDPSDNTQCNVLAGETCESFPPIDFCSLATRATGTCFVA